MPSDTPRTNAVEATCDSLTDNAATALRLKHAHELERENAKLRFLISEVIETQPVTEACRDDLRAALKA